MTELTSTETHSTQTLQTITWPTTTSGEYDVSPSPVIWWIIGIVLPVFLALLIVAIVCAVKRKRVCFCQQRPRLDDVRPKASNQTVDCDALYDEVLNSSSAASRTPARLPSEYHDGATYMYLSINRPPASIRPQRNNESDRDYYVGFCDVSAYDYADDFHVRSVRLPSIREGSQRFPISSSLVRIF